MGGVLSLKILVHGAWCFALAQPKTKASDGIAIGGTYRYTYYSSNKVLFDLSPIAVRTVIIEKATRTSRISLFGLRGGKHTTLS